jgi:hypothetical protein
MTTKPKGDGPAKVRRKPGAKPIPISQDDRDTVTRLAAVGTRQEVIARILKISVDTLQRRFRAELDCGLDEANAQVAGALFSRALAGELGAMVWWEKTRAGHRDVTRHEHGGLDGKPIELKDMSEHSDEDLAILKRAALLLAGGAAGDGGESEALS